MFQISPAECAVCAVFLSTSLSNMADVGTNKAHVYIRININMFSYIYLMIFLGHLTAIHTFLKENTRYSQQLKYFQIFTKIHQNFRNYSQTDNGVLQLDLHVLRASASPTVQVPKRHGRDLGTGLQLATC